MKKKLIGLFIVILVIPNLPIISPMIAAGVDKGYYHYSNADGSFTVTVSFEFKSGGWEGMNTTFEDFIQKTNPTSENSILYRIYTLNPLCFWRWALYFNMGRHFSYMDWEQIKKRRGYDKLNKPYWSDWKSF